MCNLPPAFITSVRPVFLGSIGALSDSNALLRGLSVADAALLLAAARALGIRARSFLPKLYIYNSSTDTKIFTSVMRDTGVPLQPLCSFTGMALSAIRQYYAVHGGVELSDKKQVEKRVKELASLLEVRDCISSLFRLFWNRKEMECSARRFHSSGVALPVYEFRGESAYGPAFAESEIKLMAVPASSDTADTFIFIALDSASFYGYHDDMDHVRFFSPYVVEVDEDYVSEFLSRFSKFCREKHFPVVGISY